MEHIESIWSFINSYSNIAKIGIFGGVAITVATLMFAPRDTQSKNQDQKKRSTYLKIGTVELFPNVPDIEIKILAYVNGTEYVHPSVGGIEWMKVGPSMSQKKIPLPTQEQYILRFELISRDPTGGNNHKRSASQEIVTAKQHPINGEYNLHAVSGVTRSASVNAIVKFELLIE